MEDFLYTINDVAELYRVNHNTVRYWVKKGKFPCLVTPSAQYRFTRQQITAKIGDELFDQFLAYRKNNGG